jgi:hypothetical protein
MASIIFHLMYFGLVGAFQNGVACQNRFSSTVEPICRISVISKCFQISNCIILTDGEVFIFFFATKSSMWSAGEKLKTPSLIFRQ